MSQHSEESTSSSQAKALHLALINRGIKAFLEHKDKYKTVDIAIPDSHIYIEVDGIQHFNDPEQIIIDLERNSYSDDEGFRAFVVTNQIIETRLCEVADALRRVVDKIDKK